jgi:hypothetical protein
MLPEFRNSTPLRMNPDVRSIYIKIMAWIKDAMEFDECKKLVESFNPVVDVDEILRRQRYLREMFERVSMLDDVTGRVEKPEFKAVRMNDRVLIVDESDYEKAVSLRICDVNVYGNYPLVLSTTGEGTKIEELSIEEIAPEIFILEIYRKKESLEKVKGVLEKVGVDTSIPEILKEIEGLEEIIQKEKIIESFEEFVYSKLREIKDRIEEKILDEEIILKGKEILEYLSSKGSFEEKFQKIEEAVIDEIIEAEREISQKFGVHADIFTKHVIPEINLEELERARREIEREFIQEKYLRIRDVMRRIRGLIPQLERDFERFYEIMMVKRLKDLFKGFTFPVIRDGVIFFRDARNLFIKNPEAISYVIGNGSSVKGISNLESISEEERKRRVILLTGANSGGKTSLLNLIVQIQLLTQMGFPIPAKEAVVDVREEIYLFTRKKSVYGAGAFESTLKNFTKALSTEGKKLILVDEFEAITEPGAAVKMLSAFLRIAEERGFYMVVVSHMAQDLQLEFVRIDGIEASGLDDELNLIVNRQPVFGKFGKSTPELIVERVYRMSRGNRKEVLRAVLEAFRGES